MLFDISQLALSKRHARERCKPLLTRDDTRGTGVFGEDETEFWGKE